LTDYTITVPDFTDYESLYQTNDLVSSTIGDPMLDSDAPIDFTAKGISTGTPCGIVFPSDAYSNDIAYPLESGALSGGFTIEFWYKSYEGSNDDYYPWIFGIGTENASGYLNSPSLSLELKENYDDYARDLMRIRLTGNPDAEYEDKLSQPWGDGAWHHFAMCYDATATKIHMFYDGTSIRTIDSTDSSMAAMKNVIDNATILHSTGMNDEVYPPLGRFAQFAVCDSCKWSTDFTVPTTAY
jgi:hypothetical protein